MNQGTTGPERDRSHNGAFLKQMTPQINYEVKGLLVHTRGLLSLGHSELKAEVDDSELLADCESFLRFVVDYLLSSSAEIKPGETLGYGYWLTNFQPSDHQTLEAWEYNARATEFIRGVNFAVKCWREQHDICKKMDACFAPPRPDKLAAVSAGVFEGDPIDAVRYPSPEHMSGWWLVTPRYNGDVKSLKCEHFYHITAQRNDVIPFIALPYGYRFRVGEGQMPEAWFDDEVANSPPN